MNWTPRKILSDKLRREVLKHLYLAGREVRGRDLARAGGLSVRQVQEVLPAIISFGIVERHLRGTEYHFSLNLRSRLTAQIITELSASRVPVKTAADMPEPGTDGVLLANAMEFVKAVRYGCDAAACRAAATRCRLSSSCRKLTALAVAILLLAAPAMSADPGELAARLTALQNIIRREGAEWTAGQTSVSALSREEWRMLAALDTAAADFPPLPETPRVELPAELDWRDNGGHYVSPVKRQKDCGSCWAFAMTAALESYVMRRQGIPGADLDLSEQVLLSCSGAGSCSGGRLNGAYLATTGLPSEEAYPYTASDGACSAAAGGWEKTAYKVGGWGGVTKMPDAIKTALLVYGPLPTTMTVYEDFMHYKGGVYSHVGGGRVGGHAVLLVGYSDPGQYFIVKNSWGEDWGENGYFRIAYSEMGSYVVFGLKTIAYYADTAGPALPAAGLDGVSLSAVSRIKSSGVH